ncbi:pyrimidine 5'-nucleotidase, variant [Verruconis gallopava]|nr:pyrimidine 5'-nucleotidase, variant [Verruconis gallopava]KIW08970.1 pyrimidine 5'-nucleotidase, variant [Verruconis gallopava]
MSNLIDKFFMTHLSLSEEDATALHQKYYKDYGLAIEGLVRHHSAIDPLEFNAQVDDALPLEDILKPDEELQKLLADLDTTKVKPWLFTNAYVTHGRRVVRLLGVEKYFEGLTYCDYAAPEGRIIAKPSREMFAKAMREAGVEDMKDCFFVDDSYMNVKAAASLGWTAVHLLYPSQPRPPTPASEYQIQNLQELRKIFPQFFKSTNSVLS